VRRSLPHWPTSRTREAGWRLEYALLQFLAGTALRTAAMDANTGDLKRNGVEWYLHVTRTRQAAGNRRPRRIPDLLPPQQPRCGRRTRPRLALSLAAPEFY
jgi:hypothetical protein